jgi:RNA polymerase sigma-70 factor, ECF subfamily
LSRHDHVHHGPKGVIPRGLAGAQQTLLTLAAAGDPAAVQQCIARYGSLVWSLARRSCASETEAEALTRDIFAQLWQQAARHEPGVGSEPLFITIVARRHLLDRLRATEPRPSLKPIPSLLAPDSPTPDPLAPSSLANTEPPQIERCSEATLAASVLATLDPSQRRMLSLAMGQGMTYAEVGQHTASSTDAAKSLVRRALVAVRKRLQARQGEAP